MSLRISKYSIDSMSRCVKRARVEMKSCPAAFGVSIEWFARVEVLLDVNNRIEGLTLGAYGARRKVGKWLTLRINIQRDIAIDLREIVVFTSHHTILFDDDMWTM